MSEQITLTLRVEGETTIEVDRAEYEQAKVDGRVDHLLDYHLSNIDAEKTVIEPDGRSYSPFDQPHGPTEPARCEDLDGEPAAPLTVPTCPHGTPDIGLCAEGGHDQ